MNIPLALRQFFEEQIEFRLKDNTPIDGNVFIGETEFSPVGVLRSDNDAYEEEFRQWYSGIWTPSQERRRNLILPLPGNAGRYSDLCDAVVRNQAVPLVGSGMSVPTGFPTWSELLRELRCSTEISEEEIDGLLGCGAFEEAADTLACGMNQRWFDEQIEHTLRVDGLRRISAAVRLLPAIFSSLVVTTNLDGVLERIYEQCEAPFFHVLSGDELACYRQLKDSSIPFLLKLHGDCRRAKYRVLLTAEYERAYSAGGVAREELLLLYRTNNLLFLGCSLVGDRSVRLVAEAARSDQNMPRHYAFLELPQTELVRVRRENTLTEQGVYPIWYEGEHDECITALLAGLLEAAGVVE